MKHYSDLSSAIVWAFMVCFTGSSHAQLKVETTPLLKPTASVVSADLPIAPPPGFDVVDSDKTVRQVLTRWSVQAGWTHKVEHWALDRELAIGGTADSAYFGKDFRGAVRKLLAGSELSDRPAQPCFYANNLVRVIPLTQACDRSVAAAAQ